MLFRSHSHWVDWAQFKLQLLVQLPPKFAIVGWSMGGLYATRLAAEHPERVTQVLNITTLPYFVRAQNWPAIMRQVLCKFHQELVADPIALVKNFIDTHAQGIIYQPSVAATADLAASLELLLHWDLRVLLVDLSMPIGYVFGGLDAIVPSRMLNVMQQQYPDLDYWLIQHAAHAPFLSHSTMMTAILKSWIKQ